MREILFRGKRLGDGEWVDGSLFVDEKKDKHEILVGYVNYRVGWEIDPDTVGQFTGLTDKNGKRIFEGDIIKHYCDYDNPERFEIGMVWWDDCHLCFKRTSDPQSVYIWGKRKYEVIGNIHDNPELLGGKQ